jgi:hypothetical protein
VITTLSASASDATISAIVMLSSAAASSTLRVWSLSTGS